MKLAPIALFVYNRPEHTRKTLEALSKNYLADQSLLYIFSDGPKPDASESELEKIAHTLQVANSCKGFAEVVILESKSNKGLMTSIVQGVNELINKYGKIIVLEDDLVTSPYFLTFMNGGLKMYQESENVYSVNAFMYAINFDNSSFDTFLSPLACSTWGWGTWKKRWEAFALEMPEVGLLAENSYFRSRFNFGHYPFMGLTDSKKSWGIRWYYHIFLRNGLGVFPTQSLVKNIGMDGSGENTEHDRKGDVHLVDKPFSLQLKTQISLKENTLLAHFLSENYAPNTPKTSVVRSLKTLAKRLISK